MTRRPLVPARFAIVSFATALFLTLIPAFSATAEEPGAPLDAPRIGHISVYRHDVFEGQSLPWLYEVADAIHHTTSERFVRRDLLFREGDPLDPAMIEESERLLRSRPIFRMVRISTATAADGTVDVTVETADTYTTNFEPSYGVAGGQQYYGLGILERNLLGEGREVGAFLFQDIDRRTAGASYGDPHFAGSRWALNSGYGSDEKGREYEIDLDRPFYSSRVRFAGGGALRVLDDEDRLFFRDDEAAHFQHETRDGRVYGAYSLQATPRRVRRVTLAYERQEDRFTDLRVNFVGPFPLPSGSRVLSAALLGFEFQNLQFRKYAHLFTFDRVEDVNMGFEGSLEAGPSLEGLGATRDGLFGRAQAQKVAAWGEHFVWFNHLDLDGRYEDQRLQDGVMQLRSEAFLVDWREDNTATLRAAWIGSRNLDPETQYILGGNTGLRAYHIRELAGANKAIATVENRQLITMDFMQLVNVGWAVFGDAGSAWQRGEALRLGDIKSDVGVGLRLSGSKGTHPGIYHIDVAYALQDNESSSRLALNIGADIHFGEREPRKFEQ